MTYATQAYGNAAYGSTADTAQDQTVSLPVSEATAATPAPTVSVASSSDWYNSNWDYRKKLTVDSTQVDASLTDYPAYLEITGDTDLANNAQSDGDDILFTKADGTTKLDHEIEVLESGQTAIDLYAHVEIPSLSASSDTDIYMYYGNSSASNQENVSGTWNSDYVAVHHLDEAVQGTGNADVYKDSAQQTHHGNDQVSASDKPNQVGEGQEFDGSDDYIDVPYSSDFDLTNFCISVWFRTSVTSNNDIKTLSNKEDPSGQYSNRNWWVALDNGQGFSGTDGAIALRTSSGGSTVSISSNSDHRDGNWHHAFALFDPSGNDEAELWIDGTEEASQSGVGSPDTQSADVLIGSENASSLPHRPWVDDMDEHRVYGVAKSSGYITTLYNNQSSPGTFWSIGSQETESTAQTVTVPASVSTGATPAPTATGAGTATVSVPNSQSTGATPTPTINPVVASVSVPVGASTGATPTPGVVAGATATVSVPVAGSTGSTPDASVTGAGTATVSVPTPQSAGATPTPTVSVGSATVNVPVGAAGGVTPAATIGGTGAAGVALPVGAATGSTPNATVTGGGTATISTPTPTAAGATPVPNVTVAGTFVAVPTASGTGASPVLGITGAGTALVSVPTPTASGATPAIGVSGTGVAGVQLPTPTTRGDTPAPAINAGVATVVLPTSGSTGTSPAPSISATGTAPVSLPSLVSAGSTSAPAISGGGAAVVSVPAATSAGATPTPTIELVSGAHKAFVDGSWAVAKDVLGNWHVNKDVLGSWDTDVDVEGSK